MMRKQGPFSAEEIERIRAAWQHANDVMVAQSIALARSFELAMSQLAEKQAAAARAFTDGQRG